MLVGVAEPAPDSSAEPEPPRPGRFNGFSRSFLFAACHAPSFQLPNLPGGLRPFRDKAATDDE